MAYFTTEYLNFFKELAGNNQKEWFDLNRKTYETVVKSPFEKFVTALIHCIEKHDSRITISHKDAIFRINRDVRFSKEKEPYKLNRSAIISPNGKKDKAFPGLYFEMGPEHFRIYGGVYQPDKEQLYTIRETIMNQSDVFQSYLTDPKFVSFFGEIHGEKNKVLPNEFKNAALAQPLIYNKQFYWYNTFDAAEIVREDLLELTESYYLANKPMMDFFAKALQH